MGIRITGGNSMGTEEFSMRMKDGEVREVETRMMSMKLASWGSLVEYGLVRK